MCAAHFSTIWKFLLSKESSSPVRPTYPDPVLNIVMHCIKNPIKIFEIYILQDKKDNQQFFDIMTVILRILLHMQINISAILKTFVPIQTSRETIPLSQTLQNISSLLFTTWKIYFILWKLTIAKPNHQRRPVKA